MDIELLNQDALCPRKSILSFSPCSAVPTFGVIFISYPVALENTLNIYLCSKLSFYYDFFFQARLKENVQL